MPAYFDLELDTTAPTIEFGYFRQPEYGEDFVLPYTLGEPKIIDAFLIDSADVAHALIVRVDGTLWRFIDPGVAPGAAQVRVTVQDNVLNQAVVELRLTVSRTGAVKYTSVPMPTAQASDFLMDNATTADAVVGLPVAMISDTAELLLEASDRSALTMRLHTRVLD